MTIKIEEGKFYSDTSGDKIGPIEWTGNVFWGDRSSGGVVGYYSSGEPFGRSLNLVAEWTDAPKTWGEMTPEEKGALLLADHEGKVIECTPPLTNGWSPAFPGISHDDFAYRVLPEPSHLPLTAGKRYKTAGSEQECILVIDGIAIMHPKGKSAAYTWDAETGKSISLGVSYDITGLAE